MVDTIPSCLFAAYQGLEQGRAILIRPLVGGAVRVIGTELVAPELQPLAFHRSGRVRAAFLIGVARCKPRP